MLEWKREDMREGVKYCVGAIPGFLLAVIIIPWHFHLGIPLSDYLQIVISALGGFALVFAGLSYYLSAKKFALEKTSKQSEQYLKEGIGSLERAYSIFTDSNANCSPPRPDRYNWLTTARIIQSYNKLKKHVTLVEHQIVLQEHEEYWRHKFYLTLDSNDMLSVSYFAKSKAEMAFDSDFANLDLSSLAVIYYFSEWKHDYIDPLDSVETAKLFAYGTILSRHHGLQSYVKLFSKISKEVYDYKKSDPRSLTGAVSACISATEKTKDKS
jgi:hypothetical protein